MTSLVFVLGVGAPPLVEELAMTVAAAAFRPQRDTTSLSGALQDAPAAHSLNTRPRQPSTGCPNADAPRSDEVIP